MNSSSNKDNLGLRVTFIGFGINLLLAILKLTFGVFGNSRALVADGIHSLADLGTDVVTGFGLYLGNLPPDEDHRFGHQKIETLTEIVLGIILFIVAVAMAIKSGIAIYRREETEIAFYTVYVALTSLIANEFLYRITVKVSRQINNKVIYVNAWHHRSDALSSLVILIGLVISYYIPELRIIDAYLSLFVAFIIFRIGAKTTWDSLKKITDSVSPKLYKEVETIISQDKKVRSFHNLKMRYIGNELHIEFHIEVDPNMTIYDGHEVSHVLKERIEKEIEHVYDVMIHIEPEGDERFPD